MSRIPVLLSSLSVAIGAILAVSSAYAAPVLLRADSTRITFESPRGAAAYQLRITGPGPFLIERVFLGNEVMSVSFRENGTLWQDGAYNYELSPVRGVATRGERTAGGARSQRGEIDSGAFALLRGSVLTPTLVPESQRSDQDADAGTKDQVIPDDLIVQGSACVGLDCVNNESFGFDTVRLKENNLRIKFDDTSTSAGFPATDWQLTANDSASGGLNKFSIEDITAAKVPFTVEGGTPTNSLYVDSTGNTGFGTSTPALDLHVTTSDTPAVRLEQNNAGGFTAQTWDIGANEANFFVRDLTGGSRLSFRIRPGAPTSSIDIAGSGNVGIGTASPGAPLDVARSGDSMIRISNTAVSGFTNDWDVKNNSATGRLTFTDDSTGLRVPFKFAPNAVDNLLRVGVLATNTVDINGNLLVTGTITPDFVFEPKFDRPSIKEHAEFMWKNRHLPKVAAAITNAEGKGVIDVGARSQGVLEELEYAHVYIEQLHDDLEQVKRESAKRTDEVRELRLALKALSDQIATQRTR